MPGLPVGQCVSIVIDRSCANSPVCCRLTAPRSAPPQSKTQHLPSEEDSCRKHVGTHCFPLSLFFSRSGLVHSIAVLFKICPCLCFGAVLCHLVAVFLPILARTFCLAIPPRCLQRYHFESRPIAFNFFPRKCLSTACGAGRQRGMRGLPYDRNQLFLYAFVKVSPG